MDIVSYILNKNSIGEIQDEVDQIEEDLVDINTELDKKVNKDELGSSAYLDAPAIGDAADNEVVLGCDSRLTDARTPVAHTHLMNEIADLPTLGTVVTYDIPVMGDALPNEVVMGDDTRLTDNRDPNPHNHVVADITDFPTLGTAAAKDYTSTYDPTSSDLVTGEAVGEAINSMPNPMIFKGSLGDGGTITQLPAPVAANEGFTYKVITEGTYAGMPAGIGDMFTCGDPDNDHIFEWVHFPSGDEPGGTVMSVKIQGSGAIAVDDESAITTSGVRTISHNDSGVSAGTYTSVTVDEKGHVTAGSNPDISYNDLTNKPTLGTAAALDVPASGNASSGQVVKGDDSRLTDARNAADVYAWAKEENKPSYTKSEVGLGNVDNTSDVDKPISTATQSALDDKVDKVSGKGLSENDFTDTLKDKLDGIASGAEVNVQADWNESDSSSDAFIQNKPTIPAAQVNADWDASSGVAEILNKPTLGTAAALDVSSTGDASTSEVVKGDDSRLTNARNAADVYSWAKASTKPSYTANEVGALADTTKYAGASTAGGAATSAEKLTNTSKIGDTNKPVYFTANGVPEAISYTIEKSVPSNAVFTDNNTTYTVATGDANGQIKVTPSSGSAYNVSVKGLGSRAYDSTNYLPLAGGTMTGVLKAQANVYTDSYTGALDMQNSNIYGVNAIYTGDAAEGAGEGINFYRDATHVDTLWMAGGDLLFVPNRVLGTNTTAANSQKVGRFTANPTTGQVVITDGTTGGMKSSGYTIAKSVPSNAVFTDTNTYVSQSASTTSNWRKVLLHYKDDAASSTAVTSSTNVVYAAVGVSVQPSTGTLAATKFSGDISSCTGLTKSQVTTALGYTPPTSDTNTTYTIATGDSAGQIKVTPSSGSAYNVNVKSIVKHLGNAGKSNMNDVGRLFPSVGMTSLSDPSNTVDNPLNGTTKSTGWHLYWDASYADDPNGSNSWAAQIVNKAGTATWWVRSRDGGTITNGTAWKSGWEHLVISPQAGQGGTTTPIYIDANGHTQSCSYTIAKSVPSNAVFTDTNNAVTQTATTTDANYEVLFSVTADNTTRTEGARKTTTLRFNPSKGSLMVGTSTVANGSGSHASGSSSSAIGNYSHAEGQSTNAKGTDSHAEGYTSKALGEYSHAEGYATCCPSDYTHAEGRETTALSQYSHAEGCNSLAGGSSSMWGAHAEGYYCTTTGDYGCHAEGYGTCATGNSQHVQGKYNTADSSKAFIIGGGSSNSDRKNIFTVDWSGNAYSNGNQLATQSWTQSVSSTSVNVTNYGSVTFIKFPNGLKMACIASNTATANSSTATAAVVPSGYGCTGGVAYYACGFNNNYTTASSGTKDRYWAIGGSTLYFYPSSATGFYSTLVYW